MLAGWTPQQKGAGGQEADATLAALDPWVVLYDDLVFGRQIGKGNFGRVFEGTYFGTTHHHHHQAPPPPLHSCRTCATTASTRPYHHHRLFSSFLPLLLLLLLLLPGTPVAIKHLFPVGEGLSVEQTRKYVDREIVLLKCVDHLHPSLFPLWTHPALVHIVCCVRACRVSRVVCVRRSLHHPHIVQLIGICDHESGQYIITELVTGGDLKTALARRVHSILFYYLFIYLFI
jgi:serine/threonine protein kinase